MLEKCQLLMKIIFKEKCEIKNKKLLNFRTKYLIYRKLIKVPIIVPRRKLLLKLTVSYLLVHAENKININKIIRHFI
jgi:hypothetical protein